MRRAWPGVLLVVALALTGVPGPAAAQVLPTAEVVVPTQFTFSGRGWGHGLGMSQYGAYGQAKEGYSATRILQHYYAPALVTSTTSNPELRVQVLATANDVEMSLVQGTWELVYGPDPDLHTVAVPGTSLVFTESGGVVSTTVNGRLYRTSSSMPQLYLQWSGTRYLAGSAGLVRVMDANAGTGSVVYRHGRLVVAPYSGQVNVLNDVLLNKEYLYGIAEMPSSWPDQALRAQVIAARTYALRAYSAGLKSYGAHLTDETSSQKFTAWNKENEATYGAYWRAAVDATVIGTSSSVVTYQGSMVQTFYSSSTGGTTMDSEQVWGGSTLAYLRHQDDHWSVSPAVANPYASWTATKTQAQVAAIFGLADVLTLTVTHRATSTAVMQIRATSSTGATADLLSTPTTDGVRTALGLRSAYFSIGSPATVTRLGGPDRYTTAIQISTQAFPDSAEVVLVSGDQRSLVDGLVAAPFARQRAARILLTSATEVPTVTLDQIDPGQVTKVWVIGGEGVIGPEVVAELEGLGLEVERLGGVDRYSTAAAVAGAMGPATSVVVASGSQASLVDAVAAAGPAAASGEPVLLTAAHELTPVTRETIVASGASSVTVVGGTGAVSTEVETELAAGWTVRRLAGPDRWSTAAAIATGYATTVGTSVVTIASGTNDHLIDGLTGGVLGTVTLLVAPTQAPTATLAWLAQRDVPALYVLGERGSVSDEVVEAIR